MYIIDTMYNIGQNIEQEVINMVQIVNYPDPKGICPGHWPRTSHPAMRVEACRANSQA